MYCPHGTYCDPDARICQPTGGSEVGEACEEDEECTTGICYEGFCDEQCLLDEDCNDGELCIWLGHERDGIGCQEFAECETNECASNERCRISGDEETCIPQGCLINGDCESGDCHLHDRPEVVVGECIEPDDPTVDRYCKPDEIWGWGLTDTFDEATEYCVQLDHQCWDDHHCEEPYECVHGYCVREVTIGQEQ